MGGRQTVKVVQWETGAGSLGVWESTSHKWRASKGANAGEWEEEQTKIEVRRFGGRSHSPCGGLHDSAVVAWIIGAIMLWVPAIIRLVHMLNIQWDILGRHAWEEAKGHLSRSTCHMPIKMCKHLHVCSFRLCVLYLHIDTRFTLTQLLGWVWPWYSRTSVYASQLWSLCIILTLVRVYKSSCTVYFCETKCQNNWCQQKVEKDDPSSAFWRHTLQAYKQTSEQGSFFSAYINLDRRTIVWYQYYSSCTLAQWNAVENSRYLFWACNCRAPFVKVEETRRVSIISIMQYVFWMLLHALWEGIG